MAGPLPVKGSEISSAPCSVQRAAGLLRRFLSGEAALEVGIAKGYIESVAQSLEEMLARRRENSGHGTEELRLATAGRSSKFFNVEQVEKIPKIKKKKSPKDKESKQLKESKQKKNDQAMVDFEALLGHELDGADVGQPANGELDFAENPAVTEMLLSTPEQAESAEDGRELQKSEKGKKKKRKSLDEAAMDVNVDEMQSARKAEAAMDSDPDVTKSAKKKKTRKSVEGVDFNGLLSSAPAKIIELDEGITRAEDEGVKPTDDGRKKKKKKKQHGATLVKEDPEVMLTEHVNSNVGDRRRGANDSEVQKGSAKKTSKKRASEESPGNSKDQHRKSKKLRLSD